MGLDMFLTASVRCSGHQHDSKESQATYDSIISALGFTDFIPDGSAYLTVDIQVGYWRKANHIHAWFVDHVQDGEDDCQRYHVTRNQLGELLSLCEQILAGVGDSSLLPTRGGFFFGGTEYDSHYRQDLQITADIIKRCLRMPDHVLFFYRASW